MYLVYRRVRSVGELVENQYRIGLIRMEKTIREKISLNENELLTLYDIINCKPLIAIVKEFFGSSQLSQFMDQTNPLSEITHKRRVSALGPGGLSRDHAGFKVRDIHLTHYGRICPIETPEGPNIGLIASLASFSRINEYGFIETPFWKINNCSLTNNIKYYSAIEEENNIIAQANSIFTISKKNQHRIIQARKKGEMFSVPINNLTLMDITPNQLVSIAAGLIPFLEHNDANRALMGSNMQRQAVPLFFADSPLIGTGMEQVFSKDSSVCTFASKACRISYVDSSKVITETFSKSTLGAINYSIDIYRIKKYKRSNQNTCINQKPTVIYNDTIRDNQNNPFNQPNFF
jgi:DNA-directed RNA polymerase subunit beta